MTLALNTCTSKFDGIRTSMDGSNTDPRHANQKEKNHFCSKVDLIRHEENWIIELQKMVEYINQHELSSFQVESNIL
jgi:hypothetical protein